MDNPSTYEHIVLIDGNKADLLSLKEILSSLNYGTRISTFENPTVAFDFLKTCEKLPDLIFLELKMPKISGFKFIEKLEEEFSETPKFIIITSSDNPSDIKKSAEYPDIIHYFIKPVSIMDLDMMEII